MSESSKYLKIKVKTSVRTPALTQAFSESTLVSSYSGRDEKLIGAHNTVVFSKSGDDVYFRNDDNDAARFVLISGQLQTFM
jgi:hypothetical protein